MCVYRITYNCHLLHQSFAHHAQRKEWFRFSSILTAYPSLIISFNFIVSMTAQMIGDDQWNIQIRSIWACLCFPFSPPSLLDGKKKNSRKSHGCAFDFVVEKQVRCADLKEIKLNVITALQQPSNYLLRRVYSFFFVRSFVRHFSSFSFCFYSFLFYCFSFVSWIFISLFKNPITFDWATVYRSIQKHFRSRSISFLTDWESKIKTIRKLFDEIVALF